VTTPLSSPDRGQPWLRPFASLRWRLAACAVLAMALGGWWLAQRAVAPLHRQYREAMEETLIDTSTILAAWVAAQTPVGAGAPETTGLAAALAGAHGAKLQARIYDLLKTGVATAVYVTDARGVVLYDSATPANVGSDFSRWNDVARTLQGRYGARSTRRDPADPASAVLHVAAPISVGGRLVGVLTVVKPVDTLVPLMAGARQGLLQAALVAALAAALVALAATMWVTRPLTRLVAWAEAVKAGGRPPAPRLGGGEVGRLAAAVGDLQASLDGRAYVERYVQHLTHELKSPLAGIRGAAELLAEDPPAEVRARFLANIAAETERLHDLVERLLQLAGLERRERRVLAQEVPLAELVDDVLSSFTALAAGKQVTCVATVEPGLVMRGERFLVRQALANLVANALDFAPAGTVVEVSAAGRDGMAELVVRDRGPGVPAWALERIFERFYSLPRPDTGRKGSGLGLAFVREVADLHGGTATVANRADGGAEAVLRIPGVYVGG
jgi:two-component system sensor histidine kinase CreC